jgi:hypothetical protein
MDDVNRLLNGLLQLVIALGDLIVGGIVAIELWLRGQLGQLGLAPQLQTAILVAIAVLLIVAALRFFGGLVRIAVVIVLALIAIHILLPVLHA